MKIKIQELLNQENNIKVVKENIQNMMEFPEKANLYQSYAIGRLNLMAIFFDKLLQTEITIQ